MSRVKTPPIVSMPSDSGTTSSSSMSSPAAGEDAGLDAGAERDDLVGVELDERRPRRRARAMWRATSGHARGAADRDDLVDVRRPAGRRP